MPVTVSGLLADARARFAGGGLDDPATDARALIGGLLGLSLTDIMVRGDLVVSPAEALRVETGVKRRLSHEPVHRILGRRPFYGLEFDLGADTLEPRPDTEVLVDGLLPHLRQIVAQKEHARVLDLGTGSGAILVSLLYQCAQASGVGSDISKGALAVAVGNAGKNGVAARFTPQLSSWYEAVSGRFDVIVSNPPYIRSDVIGKLSPDVRLYDPILALDGGSDGLDAYRAIAVNADAFLEADGIIGVEIGFDQKQAVKAIFSNAGFAVCDAIADYGGNDRALLFKRSTAV
ncbi:MAG: peptide chain release factor N(5)-glutamine methyltransferase [Allorhizobium sp.]